MHNYYKVEVQREGKLYFATQPIDELNHAVSVAEDMQMAFGHANVELFAVGINGVAISLNPKQ